MGPRDTGDAGYEELVQGDESEPRLGLRSLGAAVLLLLVGGAGGIGLAGTDTDPRPAPAPAPEGFHVTAGAVHRVDDGSAGPEFVVYLHNSGESTVRVLDVFPRGWHGSAPTATLPPDRWTSVGFDVDVDCAATDAATDELVVQTESANGPVPHVVQLATGSRALAAERSRLCPTERGRIPAADELAGIWILDRAGWLTAQLLVEFDRDGTFAMDLEDNLFTDHPAAAGRYTLTGDRLAITFLRGDLCGVQQRVVWQVRVLRGGRLWIRHLAYSDGSCSVPVGLVWRAHRIADNPVT
ncbi:MAG TPA: hypothetical protein VFG63_07765 [Nocardioidaceae bacterium]|nr:hypothetical protein [Nocardioidaceae bacterium]